MEQRRTDPVILLAVAGPFIVIGLWIISIYMQTK
jgi:hypothetical protein